MGMMPFVLFCREVADRETRTLQVVDMPGPVIPGRLPVDTYAFVELFCVDPGCDCRRVMLNVYSESSKAHLATINYAFEPPTKEWDHPEQVFLDPLNKQTPLAPGILEAFKHVVLKDDAYVQRLIRHYQMIKDGIAEAESDPQHPWNFIIPVRSGSLLPSAGRKASFLPPKRRGKRKWK
jgi:hypothetical protein